MKWVGLNVTRPAILQIDYGMNVSSCDGHTMRNTYGYGLSISNRNDPTKQATKSYSPKMTKFASLIHKILVRNQDKLGLQGADLSTVFNVCSILIYYSMPGIKDKSVLGFHPDIKHGKNHKYLRRQNSQRKNTPTVVFSLGDGRKLKWIRRVHNGKTWQIDKDFDHCMEINECYGVVVNPIDETPKVNSVTMEVEQFLHGVPNNPKDMLSFGFALRVTDN